MKSDEKRALAVCIMLENRQLKDENAELRKQLEIAVADITIGRCCGTCKDYGNGDRKTHECDIDYSGWKWRGAKESEGC